MSEETDWLKDLFTSHDRANADATSYYARLKKAGKIKTALVSEYRCSKGCLLLHVFQTPRGHGFYLPPYDLSPDLNALTSNESGRKANTRDGNRKWKAQSGMLSSAMNLGLNCDHVRQQILELDELIVSLPGRVKPQIVQPS